MSDIEKKEKILGKPLKEVLITKYGESIGNNMLKCIQDCLDQPKTTPQDLEDCVKKCLLKLIKEEDEAKAISSCVLSYNIIIG